MLIGALSALMLGQAAPPTPTVAAFSIRRFEDMLADMGQAAPAMSIEIPGRYRGEALILSFHSTWITDEYGDRERVWFARLRGFDFAGSAQPEQTRYADARTCAQVLDVMALGEHMETPATEFGGVPSGEPKPTVEMETVTMDGQPHSFMALGAFASSGTQSRVFLTGDDLSPIAVLGRVALAALQPCWTPEVPACVSTPAQRRRD